MQLYVNGMIKNLPVDASGARGFWIANESYLEEIHRQVSCVKLGRVFID